MDFDFGDHKLTILTKSRKVILTFPSDPHLSGVFIPVYDRVESTSWHHGYSRQFEELVEYIEKDDFQEVLCKGVKRKPWLKACLSYSRIGNKRDMSIEFYPWSEIRNKTYVDFYRLSDFYTDAIRLAQRRIRDIPRRLALAMSLHPRLGAGSVFRGLLGEHVLLLVLDAVDGE
jgi:hypothetical protein